MHAERLFSLIERLPAYEGVLAARIYQLTKDDEPQGQPAWQGQPGVTQGNGSTAGLRMDPALAGLVEVVET